MSTHHVPLSLRRKIVIALDPELLVPPPITDDTAEAANSAASNRFLSFKTVAWAKANIIRATEDHVFLVTSIDPTGDKTVAAMWASMFSDQDPHTDRPKEAEAALRRLSEALSRVGVSASVEVMRGEMVEQVTECVRRHRGEILLVQAPERSALASTMWYSWADLCAQQSGCPTVIVKRGDLPDNVAVALDPPLPTATTAADPADGQQQPEPAPK
ncbi:hypothetical protein LPJ73_005658 [Coemansia sp. RSA 2703]|nr:hypothetical protein LPJ73_005658 [Coemansia sp. RSA 2703]